MKFPIAAFALLLSACATAEPIRGADLRDLAAELTLYAVRETGLPPAPPPEIVFVEDVRALAMDQGSALAEKANALYDLAARRIYLPATWTGNTAHERALLIHELTHHLQNSADSAEAFRAHFRRRFPDHPLCLRTVERDACAVQLQYFLDASRRLPPAGRTVADLCETLTVGYSCEPDAGQAVSGAVSESGM